MRDVDETWRPVHGHKNSYEVSNFGRVRSLDRLVRTTNGYTQRYKGKLLTLRRVRFKRTGYIAIKVCIGPRRSNRQSVSVLVLEAFRGPRPDGLQALHRDGDSTNNHVDNLYWGTASQNGLDSVRHGTHPSTAKEECPLGHLLQPPNLRTCPGRINRRYCRSCSNPYSMAAYRNAPRHRRAQVRRDLADQLYATKYMVPGHDWHAIEAARSAS